MDWRKSTYSTGNGGECVEVASWRKSTYSTGSGGECVEVASWRKSTYSTGDGGQCVEVASDDMIMVRDTANRAGGTLSFSAAAWVRFLSTIR